MLKEIFVDRGYRGITKVGPMVQSPKAFSKKISRYRQKKLRKGFSIRAAIEPVIGHLKSDYRLSRNFHKGIKGDNIAVKLAAAAKYANIPIESTPLIPEQSIPLSRVYLPLALSLV